MTVLEAQVAPDKWAALETAYTAGIRQLPPQMARTFLIHSATDSTVWRVISTWRSRAALDEMRRSTEVPAGVLMFRAAGAEPALSVFDIVVQSS